MQRPQSPMYRRALPSDMTARGEWSARARTRSPNRAISDPIDPPMELEMSRRDGSQGKYYQAENRTMDRIWKHLENLEKNIGAEAKKLQDLMHQLRSTGVESKEVLADVNTIIVALSDQLLSLRWDGTNDNPNGSPTGSAVKRPETSPPMVPRRQFYASPTRKLHNWR